MGSGPAAGTAVSPRDVEELLRIGREAAAIVSAVYATAFEVEMKGPGDPVTRADREANDLICARLEARFPGVAILAEESVPDDPEDVAALARSSHVFYVDPLDGTREFADRNGEFAVMIGLSEQGRAVAGVVVLPATGDALAGVVSTAGAGALAFLEDAHGGRRPLAVSAPRDPGDARMVVSRSHRPRLVSPLMARLGIRNVVPCGSVGLKVARVATGEADLYVHGGGGAKRWDSCAPEAILVAAGGRFTDLCGDFIDYASADLRLSNGIVASSEALHAEALAALREIRA